MTVVVFLGPSLPLEEAQALLPEAVFLPPARQADVATALTLHDPDVIALVDGEFHQARSVWHKEILVALERGTRVYGSSSMGALRAAELAPFGMLGRGEVFTLYASGELLDDDEVALTYAYEDGLYHRLSEPMVNIRATVRAALTDQVITKRTARTTLEIAKGFHYRERSRPRVIKALRERGVEQAGRLDSYWLERPVDVKAADARAVLAEIAGSPQAGARSRDAHPLAVAPTAGLDTLYNREREVTFDGLRIALSDIADHVQLHHPRAGRLTGEAMNRAAALALAELLRLSPSERETDEEVARWRVRHGCEDDTLFESWLRRNHVTADEFRTLARKAAQCRALHRWLLYAHHTERNANFVLDQLRWSDEFEDWGSSAAVGAEAARQSGVDEAAVAATLSPVQLREEHEAWAGQAGEGGFEEWAEEAGFHSTRELTLALARARSMRIGMIRAIRRASAEAEEV
ncbi:TfuA-like protein [Streptomyces sp. NPDC004838]